MKKLIFLGCLMALAVCGLREIRPVEAQWNIGNVMAKTAGDSAAAVEARAAVTARTAAGDSARKAAGDSVAAVAIRSLAAAKVAAGDSARKAAGDSVAAVEARAAAAAKQTASDSLALALLRSEIATEPVCPLPDLVDRTGIVNVPDSVLAIFEDPATNKESMYLRSYGSGSVADTIKAAARYNNLIKGSADSAYVEARTDSAAAVIKVIITVKDMAGNTIVSGTITPSVDDTWSRAAFPLLLAMDAEEVVITYTIITAAARYIDVTALRFKEAS